MHKSRPVGIDVSAQTLDVALAGPVPRRTSATFDNTPEREACLAPFEDTTLVYAARAEG
jgi:hypothetical protein